MQRALPKSADLRPFDLRSSKWNVPVLFVLRDRELRFTAMRSSLPGISSKALSSVLHHLERDGLVARKSFACIPPRVDYWLTPLGDELAAVLAPVATFVEQQRPAIAKARRMYDERGAAIGGIAS